MTDPLLFAHLKSTFTEGAPVMTPNGEGAVLMAFRSGKVGCLIESVKVFGNDYRYLQLFEPRELRLLEPRLDVAA